MDDSMVSSTMSVADGRRKAAARIKARIQEEKRLGIRKKKLSKAELVRKSKKQYFEKPPWNDDNAVGGDGVNGEKAFRQRSLNQKVSMRENKRQVAIKKAIVEFERRGDEENRGGAVRLSTASGLGYVVPQTNYTAPKNLNIRRSTEFFSKVATRTKNDPVIKKSFTDRSNGSPLRTRYMSSPRQSIDTGTNATTLVTRATSPFNADKLRGLGFSVPKENQHQHQQHRNTTVIEKASKDSKEPDFIDIPEYKERRKNASRSPSPNKSKLQLQQQQEVASLASAIENLSSMIGGMQQQQYQVFQQSQQQQQQQQQEGFPPPTPMSALASTPIPQTPHRVGGVKKNEGEVTAVGGRFMADDIVQMEEVLKRYDADAKQSPGRKGEILFEDPTTNAVEVEVNSVQANNNNLSQQQQRVDSKEVSERIDLNIDCDKSMIERINRYRRDFARHREVGEASLLNSGYQQWQVIEVISDDLVKRLVDKVAKEVDDTMRSQAEKIVNKL
ncbi:hypothetical protein TL16_g02753 [Triparma laevis f. inornata]|uniref:Uncharacterized protein n=1 Tax=Triparma laevis f. inornata TaxID=1714386 RepID=A0A9W6ZZ20_9STRA|nr:hypothetical protein TL16_g02753 [Triparma laevis f. inornata]